MTHDTRQHVLTISRVKPPKGYFTFGSFPSQNEILQKLKISHFVIGIAKEDKWEKHSFRYLETNFELIRPKESAHIDSKHWESSVRLIWKSFTEKFGNPTSHIVFVDLDGPISGGPLGENVFGIFASEKVSAKMQLDMKENLGWEPKPTTKAYVDANYPNSANKWNEYLFGTFAHEIGHLFFGFGMTRERITSAHELWFSLGMGMIYDMEITQSLVGQNPKLEVDIINMWLSRFSNISDLDQKLINPKTDNDKKHGFDRKKVFAHGKSAYYLQKLRENIGEKEFDAAAVQYVKTCGTCTKGYEDFKKFLGKHSDKVTELEKIHKIR